MEVDLSAALVRCSSRVLSNVVGGTDDFRLAWRALQGIAGGAAVAVEALASNDGGSSIANGLDDIGERSPCPGVVRKDAEGALWLGAGVVLGGRTVLVAEVSPMRCVGSGVPRNDGVADAAAAQSCEVSGDIVTQKNCV